MAVHTFGNGSSMILPELVQFPAEDYLFVATQDPWMTNYYSKCSQWILVVLAMMASHHLILQFLYQYEQGQKKHNRLPPLVPYALPVVGNVIEYLWDPWTFVSNATSHAGRQTVARVKLLGWNVYLLQGKENIQAAWRSSSLATPTFVLSYALGTIFGMPAKAVTMYERDDTGITNRPTKGSVVEPHNRIDFKTHQLLGKLLAGAGLVPLFERFQSNLNDMVENLDVAKEWTTRPDLFALLQQDLTPCIIKALCGPTLLRENPDFITTFWQFNDWLPTLSKRIPRILAHRAYECRDKLINSVKKWHTVARQGYQQDGSEAVEYEPLWGSSCMRERQAMFSSVDNFDDDNAMASADLGMIWATNTNAVTATFWTIFEIFKDQDLLARVRAEVFESMDSTTNKIDVQKLLKQPLLQSIYTEVLRLRTHVYITRGSKSSAATIREWIFPRGEVVLIPTTPSHLDPEAWYAGEDESHPADTFWADRFLVPSEDRLEFSMNRSKGLWFPYGGGSRVCPGRHFAKREIMVTAAQFAHSFDIKINVDSHDPKMRRGDYGLRILGPANAIPFEIRRRY